MEASFRVWVIALVSAFGSAGACTNGDKPTDLGQAGAKAPPSELAGDGGSSALDASGGGPAPAGAGGAGEIAASGGGQGGSGDLGLACQTAADCPTDGFCHFGHCGCGPRQPTLCGDGEGGGAPLSVGACVALESDPDHCGECGTSCEPGAGCVDGACGAAPSELLVAPGCGSIELASDGTNLYWTEAMTGKVRSMPLAGGAVLELASEQLAPTAIAVDGSGVYWAEQGDGSRGSSKIMKRTLPLTDGAPELVVGTLNSSYPFLAFALQGSKLYYTHLNDVHQLSLGPPAPGAPVSDVIIGTSQTGLGPFSGGPLAVVATDALAIWLSNYGYVTARRLDSTAPITDPAGYISLGRALSGTELVVDASYVYWAAGNSFFRNRLDATAPIADGRIFTTPHYDAISAIAIDGASVYAAANEGLILRHSLLPPADPSDETTFIYPQPIARDQPGVSSLLLLGGKLYWAAADCAIRSLTL